MNSKFIKKIISCKKGGTAIEYGLIVALLVIASMSALTAMSSTVIQNFNNTSSKISRAMGK